MTIKVISGDNPATVSGHRAKKQALKERRLNRCQNLADGRRLAPSGEPVYSLWSGDTRAKEKPCRELAGKRGIKSPRDGDGVNDILALKAADCSIAMESGNDATKKD